MEKYIGLHRVYIYGYTCTQTPGPNGFGFGYPCSYFDTFNLDDNRTSKSSSLVHGFAEYSLTPIIGKDFRYYFTAAQLTAEKMMESENPEGPLGHFSK